jgi:hypothetical protein
MPIGAITIADSAKLEELIVNNNNTNKNWMNMSMYILPSGQVESNSDDFTKHSYSKLSTLPSRHDSPAAMHCI